MTDNRRILTWTLRAGYEDYNTDLEKYGHKIYAIGIHEFSVQGDGSINDRRTGYNATSTKFPEQIETDMLNWPHIKWYLSMTLFGTDDLFPMLDNTTNQDAFISNLQTIVNNYKYDRSTGTNELPVHGIEIDFEASLVGYETREGDDVKYINLLKRVKNEVCIPNGLKLQVNAYSMTGEGNPYYYRFHNYKLFAEETDGNGDQLIDSLQIMTYDFAWPGSAPGASTPVWWFRKVGDWAKQNFDPEINPNAKLTIDEVFLGCAGYGNRWPIFDPSITMGRNVTYRNFLDWQNGLYRHNHSEGSYYVWHDQEFLYQNGFQDTASLNQVMYQHVYDFANAKYGDIKKYNEVPTAYRDVYNDKKYITSYSRTQQADFSGVKDVTNSPTETVGKVSVAGTATGIEVSGTTYDFTGYKTERLIYEAKSETDPETGETTYYCELESTGEGKIEFTLNPGTSGYHRVIALVSFPWYTQKKLGCLLNPTKEVDPETGAITYSGGTQITIGGDSLPYWYPLMFKGYHRYDMGEINLNASGNLIVIDGANTQHGTIVYGFVVCSSFSHNFEGGAVEYDLNVQPFKKKDGTDAAIPSNFVFTTELLRQDARPAILWEDYFNQYLNDEAVQTYGLTEGSFYYRKYGTYRLTGGSSNYSDTLQCDSEYQDGLSQGDWFVNKNEYGEAYAQFNESMKAGQLMLNHKYYGNVNLEAEIVCEEGDAIGLRFGNTSPGDGYCLKVIFRDQIVRLEYGDYPNVTIIADQPLSEFLDFGERINIRAIVHNGKGYFYVGEGWKQMFRGDNVINYTGDVNTSTGEVDLDVSTGGGCGVWGWNCNMKVYRLTIGTTDRWEPLEKFEIEIDGMTYQFGEVARTGYSYDEWGYLVYSGIDETNDTRDDPKPMPDDYEFFMQNIPGFQGAKKVTIRFKDPGTWFANYYVGDAEGCSITYTGDAYSFIKLMNIAVYDYGFKGLGLWTMGQEDPKLFEMVPDVIPR